MYLTLLNRTLKMVCKANFMLYIFYHNCLKGVGEGSSRLTFVRAALEDESLQTTDMKNLNLTRYFLGSMRQARCESGGTGWLDCLRSGLCRAHGVEG